MNTENVNTQDAETGAAKSSPLLSDHSDCHRYSHCGCMYNVTEKNGMLAKITDMKIEDVNESEMDDFLCEFLRQMLDKTENRKEIERAVDALNDTLYEYGGSKSMCYDSRDGAAFIAG